MPGRSSKLRSGQLNQAIYSDTKVRLNAVTERERQHRKFAGGIKTTSLVILWGVSFSLNARGLLRGYLLEFFKNGEVVTIEFCS
jgi:hypothetical protein